MSGLMDDPVNDEIPVEIALVVSGRLPDERSAYEKVHEIQKQVLNLVDLYPGLKVSLCQATVGSDDSEQPKGD